MPRAGHPPGALTFYVVLVRLGLGGGLAAGIVTTLVAATTALAVMVTLRALGAERMARRAEEMTHVLAPRPGGVLAALEAAPEADVLMVAHTGLDHLVTVSDLWRELPMDKQITMRWWQVSRAEIPEDRDLAVNGLDPWPVPAPLISAARQLLEPAHLPTDTSESA